MPNYKVVFIQNTIATCKETMQELPTEYVSNVYFHHNPTARQLVFAIINCQSKELAIKKAEELIKTYLKKNSR